MLLPQAQTVPSRFKARLWEYPVAMAVTSVRPSTRTGIVLLVVVLIFGTKKLRNIGADLGGAVRGFKDGMRESGDKVPALVS